MLRYKAHSREVAEYLAAGVRESLGNGDAGWWDDWVALIKLLPQIPVLNHCRSRIAFPAPG